MVSSVISIVALLLTLSDDLPYGYFTLLRWLVCGTAVYRALRAIEAGYRGWTFTFLCMAALFNPFIPVGMPRESWRAFDILSALIIFASLFQARLNKSRSDASSHPGDVGNTRQSQSAIAIDVQRQQNDDSRVIASARAPAHLMVSAGMTVLCINDDFSQRMLTRCGSRPVKGCTYTVRSVRKVSHEVEMDSGTCLALDGVHNPPDLTGVEPLFAGVRFRIVARRA